MSAHPSVLAQNITTQQGHINHQGKGLGPVESTPPEKPSRRSIALVVNNLAGRTSSGAADHCSTNITSPVQQEPTLSNHMAYDILDQNVTTTNGTFANQSDLFPYNSVTVQRASTLSKYTADGVIAYDSLDQDIATTEMVSFQPALPPNDNTTVQRAPIFSNYTANGAMAYYTPDQDVGEIFASQSDLFPYNSVTVQRASTLTNYTADRSMAYDSLDQNFGEIFGSQSDLFPLQ